MAKTKRIGALWKTRKQGWITGNMDISLTEKISVGVGMNEKKRQGSKDPDFYIYLILDEQEATSTPPAEDDEVPF